MDGMAYCGIGCLTARFPGLLASLASPDLIGWRWLVVQLPSPDPTFPSLSSPRRQGGRGTCINQPSTDFNFSALRQDYNIIKAYITTADKDLLYY
jgi:hypothetical protein